MLPRWEPCSHLYCTRMQAAKCREVIPLSGSACSHALPPPQVMAPEELQRQPVQPPPAGIADPTPPSPPCPFPPWPVLQQAGGAIFAHSAWVHLDRATVHSNSATEGGGIALAGGSRLTARESQLGGNALAGASGHGGTTAGDLAGAATGADLLLLDADNSAAYVEPLPEAGALLGEAAALFWCCFPAHTSLLQGARKDGCCMGKACEPAAALVLHLACCVSCSD